MSALYHGDAGVCLDIRLQVCHGMVELTALIADNASMDSAFDLLADNFLRGRRPNVAGVIASAQAVQPDDRFRFRSPPYFLVPDESTWNPVRTHEVLE